MSDINKLITGNLEIWCSAIQNKKTTGRGSSKKIKLVGIDNLRDLIIELALQGKLIKQDANDTPASHLIDEIKVKRAELTKKKLIKRQSTKVNYELLEKPYAIPSNWEWSSIGELCEITPKNELSDDVEASFIPMPMISTSYSGEHDQEVKKWGEIKKGFTHFADGDIALAKITPCFENSKAAIFKGLKNGVGSGTTELHVARPLVEKVNARYLLLFLKSPLFLSVGESKMTGSAGQKRVPKDFFTTYSLPLAPVEEQSRIVSKVDELMVLCDQLEQQTEASIDAHKLLVEELLSTLFLPAEGSNSESAQAFEQNWARIAEHFDLLFTTEHSIEQLKQTTLQLAVMGKLVPQNTEHVPASVLIKEVTETKQRLIKEKLVKKQSFKTNFAKEKHSAPLPLNWEWSSISELAEINPRNAAKGDSLASFIPMPLISKSYKGEHGQETRAWNEIKKGYTHFSDGDLALAKITPCFENSKAAVFSNLENGVGAGTTELHVARFLDARINPLYALLFIKTPLFLETGKRHMTGSAGQKRVPKDFFATYPMPLPPAEEQALIVEKVDSLMSMCEQMKDFLSAATKLKVDLSEAIVASALN